MNKKPIKTYPINLILREQPCLVVGGGRVAARKVQGLLATEARVTVIAKQVFEPLRQLAASGCFTLIEKSFAFTDLNKIKLVFAATDDQQLNAAIITAAQQRGILCCAVDENWPTGDFITPAVFNYKDVTVAVSTGGRNYHLARRLRLALEKLLPELMTKP